MLPKSAVGHYVLIEDVSCGRGGSQYHDIWPNGSLARVQAYTDDHGDVVTVVSIWTDHWETVPESALNRVKSSWKAAKPETMSLQQICQSLDIPEDWATRVCVLKLLERGVITTLDFHNIVSSAKGPYSHV